ncbi:MAG: hypothetical protein ACOY4C_04705, partial [Pseudomonadota bacterium]
MNRAMGGKTYSKGGGRRKPSNRKPRKKFPLACGVDAEAEAAVYLVAGGALLLPAGAGALSWLAAA